jgi:type I restriction enzyme M protein
MRVIAPWRAFGDHETFRTIVPECAQVLIGDIERERDHALVNIEEAFMPLLSSRDALRSELLERGATAAQAAPKDKGSIKAFREAKNDNAERMRKLIGELKVTSKYEVESSTRRDDVSREAAREMDLVREAAEDLVRISDSPAEAVRWFFVAEREEIELNEFNLNLPRYVDTFTPRPEFDLDELAARMDTIVERKAESWKRVTAIIGDKR